MDHTLLQTRSDALMTYSNLQAQLRYYEDNLTLEAPGEVRTRSGQGRMQWWQTWKQYQTNATEAIETYRYCATLDTTEDGPIETPGEIERLEEAIASINTILQTGNNDIHHIYNR